MTASFSREDLAWLVEIMREEDLDPEDHARLQIMLRENPDARRYFVQQRLLQSDLRTLLEEASLGTGLLRSMTFTGRRKLTWVAAAAALMVMLGSYLAYRWEPAWNAGRNALIAQSSPVVAKLVATMDTQWPKEHSIKVGDALLARPLRLEQGLAELRFASGASVVLQGPAECVLESPSHLLLRLGRLSANVPAKALGFTVRTPTAAVIDLGTEFGIHSTERGNTDVHVFRGQVALGKTPRYDSKKELITAGMAIRVLADSTSTELLRPDELAFVSYQEFDARLKAKEDKPYYRWLAATYRLRRDPSLILFYSFDRLSVGDDYVVNQSGATAGKLDAQLGNGAHPSTRPERMPSGRWPAQRALRFDASRNQQLQVEHSNELNITQALTIAAWIRPTMALMNTESVIVSKQPSGEIDSIPNYEMGLVRQADESGGGRCALYFGAGQTRVTTDPCYVIPGQWIHVLATADEDGVGLYLDGVLRGTGEGASFKPNGSDLLIGSRPHRELSTGLENLASFEGLISEVFLARCKMSPEEVHKLYSTGKHGF